MRPIAAWALIAAGLVTVSTPRARADEQPDGAKLFIQYGCGWCHEGGGRRAGKGPKLMDSTRSDEFMIERIAGGKPGKMPAFGGSLDIDQIHAIVHYIRELKPQEESGGQG